MSENDRVSYVDSKMITLDAYLLMCTAVLHASVCDGSYKTMIKTLYRHDFPYDRILMMGEKE